MMDSKCRPKVLLRLRRNECTRIAWRNQYLYNSKIPTATRHLGHIHGSASLLTSVLKRTPESHTLVFNLPLSSRLYWAVFPRGLKVNPKFSDITMLKDFTNFPHNNYTGLEAHRSTSLELIFKASRFRLPRQSSPGRRYIARLHLVLMKSRERDRRRKSSLQK